MQKCTLAEFSHSLSQASFFVILCVSNHNDFNIISLQIETKYRSSAFPKRSVYFGIQEIRGDSFIK